MALCTQDQVEQRLQIDFGSDPDPVVAELIAAATGHIERELGRTVEAAAKTETFDAPSTPDLWLRYTPVNSITSVTVDGGALTASDYTFTSDGRLTRTVNNVPRSWAAGRKLQTVAVAYNGGWSTVPTDIQDLCARMAARAFVAGAAFANTPAGTEGIRSVSLDGSDSVEYAENRQWEATASATRGVILTKEELELLRYYRNQIVA